MDLTDIEISAATWALQDQHIYRNFPGEAEDTQFHFSDDEVIDGFSPSSVLSGEVIQPSDSSVFDKLHDFGQNDMQTSLKMQHDQVSIGEDFTQTDTFMIESPEHIYQDVPGNQINHDRYFDESAINFEDLSDDDIMRHLITSQHLRDQQQYILDQDISNFAVKKESEDISMEESSIGMPQETESQSVFPSEMEPHIFSDSIPEAFDHSFEDTEVTVITEEPEFLSTSPVIIAVSDGTDEMTQCEDYPKRTLKDLLSADSVSGDELLKNMMEESPLSSPSPSSPLYEVSDSDDYQPSTKKSPRSGPYSIEERKLRKKEQNKRAALRYRQKKKMEEDALKEELDEQEKRQKELKERYLRVHHELEYSRGLARLMVEARKKASK